MTGRKWLSALPAVLGAGLVGYAPAAAQQPDRGDVPARTVSIVKKDGEVHIGFPASVFRNVPPNLLDLTSGPFNKIVRDQTGLTSQVTHDAEWFKVADKLVKGEYDIAVFLGHEFAWAKEKYPEIEAMVTAVPSQRKLQAFLVVKYDCPAKTVADLKGAKIGLPNGFMDMSALFYQSQVRKYLGGGKPFEITNPATIEDALNAVAGGRLAMTVTDSASWTYYQGNNPGRASNLRFLAESEVFPLACIAYRKGGLSPEYAEKLQRGMAGAADNPTAKVLLRMIKLQGFEAPGAAYAADIRKIGAAYPADKPVDLEKLK